MGSTSLLGNSFGNEIKAHWYTPYGSDTASTGAAKLSYKYNDKEHDDTGMYYYIARYQDPELGRFMSADTILPSVYDSQQLNRFTYVRSNPVKLIDPDGHASGPLYPMDLSVNTRDVRTSKEWRERAVETAKVLSEDGVVRDYIPGPVGYIGVSEEQKTQMIIDVVEQIEKKHGDITLYPGKNSFSFASEIFFTGSEIAAISRVSGLEYLYGYLPGISTHLLQSGRPDGVSMLSPAEFEASLNSTFYWIAHSHLSQLVVEGKGPGMPYAPSADDMFALIESHKINGQGISHVYVDDGTVITFGVPGTPYFQPDVWDEQYPGWIDQWERLVQENPETFSSGGSQKGESNGQDAIHPWQ